MSDSDRMPKVDLTKLPAAQAHALNLLASSRLKHLAHKSTLRRTNLLTGLCLALTGLGIYGYTIYSISQETFLDDFNEPEKVLEQP